MQMNEELPRRSGDLENDFRILGVELLIIRERFDLLTQPGEIQRAEKSINHSREGR